MSAKSNLRRVLLENNPEMDVDTADKKAEHIERLQAKVDKLNKSLGSCGMKAVSEIQDEIDRLNLIIKKELEG